MVSTKFVEAPGGDDSFQRCRQVVSCESTRAQNTIPFSHWTPRRQSKKFVGRKKSSVVTVPATTVFHNDESWQADRGV